MTHFTLPFQLSGHFFEILNCREEQLKVRARREACDLVSLSLVKTQLLTKTRLSRVGNFFGLCTLLSHGRSCHSWPPSLSPPTKKLSSPLAAAAASAASSHGTAHLGSHLHNIFLSCTSQAKAPAASTQHHRESKTLPWPEGRSPPELFPTDTSSPGEDAEAPLRRQRVRYTSELYAELAALLPGIPRRASQVDILDAAVAHLKVLEDTAGVLESYRALQHDAEPRRRCADVEVASREAVCFAARLPAGAARPGVLEAFDRRGVEVLAATMTRRGDGAAQVTAPAAPEITESIKAEIAGIE
ncbi:hypothetical protein ACQ4PT_071244 [Festuca glaucescens]